MVMRAYIASHMIGSFAFDEKGKIIEHRLFPKNDIALIAEKFSKIKEGKIIEEELDIMRKLSKEGVTEFVWNKKEAVKEFNCVNKENNIAEVKLRDEFRSIALKLRWVTTQAEINKVLSDVNVALSKKVLKKEKKDKLIMNAIGVYDEMEKVINTFSERLKEWYGLHFPEMGRRIQSNEKYVEMVAKFGDREKIEDKGIAGLAKGSSGMAFGEIDMEQVKIFAEDIMKMIETKEKISKYIEDMSQETMPNMCAIANPIICSRLLMIGGGLEKLARMPSSTIQLLGAEKALFRHLKGEGKAPKYGVLFAHPMIQNAPKEKKGKIARLLASKLTLAARIDFYSGENRSEDLKKELEKQFKEITKA